MAKEQAQRSRNWSRLRTSVRSAAAAIDSEPRHLAPLKPIAEDALEILSREPSGEALQEIDYLLQRMGAFVEKWRPSPEPMPGVFYVQPQWAETVDREVQEARRMVQEMESGEPIASSHKPTSGTMKVFVSHCSADKQIAEAFVDLLRDALLISAKEIRCTSVDGYKLAAGTNSEEQLRQEVFDAQAFLVLLSPTSLRSIYVMFELGARWSTKRYLAPVMVAGLGPKDLEPPLSAIHAVAGTSESDLHHFIDTLSKQLGITPETPAVYLKALAAFINASKAP